MNAGEIQQVGAPIDIYNEPVNAYVADFIGESNILDGVMLEDYKVRLAGHTFDCVDKGFDANEPVDVVIRPEDVDVVAPEKGMLTGLVTQVTFMGVHYEIIVEIDHFKWMIQTTDYVAQDSRIDIYIEPDVRPVRRLFVLQLRARAPFRERRRGGAGRMKRKCIGNLAAAPHVVWSILFIIAPLLFVLYYTLTDPEGGFTLENISRLFTGNYVLIFLNSLCLALIATVICLALAYPLAYLIASMKQKRQKIIILLIMLPLWMNFLITTYSWMTLLEDTGVINTLLSKIGLDPVHMINTPGAVICGMVFCFFPYMVLPIEGPGLQRRPGDDPGHHAAVALRRHLRHYDGVRALGEHLLHLPEAGRRKLSAHRRHHRELLYRHCHQLPLRRSAVAGADGAHPAVHGRDEPLYR